MKVAESVSSEDTDGVGVPRDTENDVVLDLVSDFDTDAVFERVFSGVQVEVKDKVGDRLCVLVAPNTLATM